MPDPMPAQEIIERILSAHWDITACQCWVCRAGRKLKFGCYREYIGDAKFPVPEFPQQSFTEVEKREKQCGFRVLAHYSGGKPDELYCSYEELPKVISDLMGKESLIMFPLSNYRVSALAPPTRRTRRPVERIMLTKLYPNLD